MIRKLSGFILWGKFNQKRRLRLDKRKRKKGIFKNFQIPLSWMTLERVSGSWDFQTVVVILIEFDVLK